jgi:hypothetical protein
MTILDLAPFGFVHLYEAVHAVGLILRGTEWVSVRCQDELKHQVDTNLSAIEDTIKVIAEACEGGNLASAFENHYRGADALDRDKWRVSYWQGLSYFAKGEIVLDLPLLDAQPIITVRCPRKIFIRKDSLSRFVNSLAPVTQPKQRTNPVARRGRKPAYDWAAIQKATFKLMDHHGPFSVDDPDWNAQARLEDALTEKFGVGISTLREQLPKFLADWRKTKVGN